LKFALSTLPESFLFLFVEVLSRAASYLSTDFF
jgi:hypothetical protein